MAAVAAAPPRQAAERFIAARGSPEWDAAWRALGFALAGHGLGTGFDLAQECDGEAWQYLLTERPDGCGHLMHEFRHRFHPVTLRREYLTVVSPLC